MEAEKTLTNEEIIRELLDLLKKNTMKEQANDVFEICTYVDGLEKKIVSMTEELTSMQDQIKKMQEDTLINNANAPAMGKIGRDFGHAFSFASKSSRGIYTPLLIVQ